MHVCSNSNARVRWALDLSLVVSILSEGLYCFRYSSIILVLRLFNEYRE